MAWNKLFTYRTISLCFYVLSLILLFASWGVKDNVVATFNLFTEERNGRINIANNLTPEQRQPYYDDFMKSLEDKGYPLFLKSRINKWLATGIMDWILKGTFNHLDITIEGKDYSFEDFAKQLNPGKEILLSEDMIGYLKIPGIVLISCTAVLAVLVICLILKFFCEYCKYSKSGSDGQRKCINVLAAFIGGICCAALILHHTAFRVLLYFISPDASPMENVDNLKLVLGTSPHLVLSASILLLLALIFNCIGSSFGCCCSRKIKASAATQPKPENIATEAYELEIEVDVTQENEEVQHKEANPIQSSQPTEP